jgi:5'-methylthioadenosine phosphorylase
MEPVSFAIIGGSGLYNMPELAGVETHNVDTPFGKPSDSILIGTMADVRVAFLPRHGRGHVLSPSEVPYRANIWALKALGVSRIISVTACGSLREDYAPGDIVIPDQIYDNTRLDRGRTFFSEGLVAHVGVADPFCAETSQLLAEATLEAGGTVHRGGAFVTIEGPRFSTKAESLAYRQLGFSIIGMTASPEAFLAREAEICYAAMAHVTDYDVWHESGVVTAAAVFETFGKNLRLAQRTVVGAIKKLAEASRGCTCGDALANTFATAPDRIPAETLVKLAPIVQKYFPAR